MYPPFSNPVNQGPLTGLDSLRGSLPVSGTTIIPSSNRNFGTQSSYFWHQ